MYILIENVNLLKNLSLTKHVKKIAVQDIVPSC